MLPAGRPGVWLRRTAVLAALGAERRHTSPMTCADIAPTCVSATANPTRRAIQACRTRTHACRTVDRARRPATPRVQRPPMCVRAPQVHVVVDLVARAWHRNATLVDVPLDGAYLRYVEARYSSGTRSVHSHHHMQVGVVDANDHPTTLPVASPSPPTATSYKAARYPVVLGTTWGRSSTPRGVSLPAEDPRRHHRRTTPWPNGPPFAQTCRTRGRHVQLDVLLQDRTGLQATVQHEHLQGSSRRS